jgi:WD40 repeat protein
MKTVLAFTPDGTHIVSCVPCRPFRLQLHAAGTGKLVKAIKLDSPAGALTFSPDGKLLAVHCWDGEVLILAPDLAKHIHALKVQQPPKHVARMPVGGGVAFAGNGHLAVVSGSLQVELFDTSEWKQVRTFGRQKDEKINGVVADHVINSIAASPDGRWLAAGYGRTNNAPGKIRVFEVRTGNTVVELD